MRPSSLRAPCEASSPFSASMPNTTTVLDELPDTVAGDLDALFAPVADEDPLPVARGRARRASARRRSPHSTVGATHDLVDVEVVGVFSGPRWSAMTAAVRLCRPCALATRVTLPADRDNAPGHRAGRRGGHERPRRHALSARIGSSTDRRTKRWSRASSSVMLLSTGAVALLALIGLLAATLSGSGAPPVARAPANPRREPEAGLVARAHRARTARHCRGRRRRRNRGIAIVLVLAPCAGARDAGRRTCVPPSPTVAPWVIVGVAVCGRRRCRWPPS